jgi:tetratricopeptide (TPR) repeat protein
VREVIGRRLNRLSQRCNEALTVASILGREFTLTQLGSLIEEVTEDRLFEILEEALAARVVEELPQSVGRYQFTHALIQETLSGELSTTRRVRLHARIAEALEELYGDAAAAHAAELAHHFSEAEAMLGSEKLARYSLLAGERALSSYAYEDALAHFERGLVARGIPLLGAEEAPDEEAAAFLFGLARARAGAFDQNQSGEAFVALSRAFEYYFKAKNVAQAVIVAEYLIAAPGARIPGIAQLIARALTLVPPDSHEAGKLLSRYGGVLGAAEGDYEGAKRAMERAISIARREGDVLLEVQTLVVSANVSFQHLFFQESVDNTVRSIEMTTIGENNYIELASRYRVAAGLLRLGDLDAARPHTMALLEIARRRSTTRIFTRISSEAILSLSCLEGDWNKGRESSDQGLEVAPRNSILLLSRALLEYETGEPTQGAIYLDRLLEAMRREAIGDPQTVARTSMAVSAIARITGLPNRLEIAKTSAEQVLAERDVSEQAVRPITILNARVALALLAVHNSSGSPAEKQYDYLLGQRGTIIETMISVDRLLALLSRTMANLDQSIAHFGEALAFCRRSGCRPELAWTCCDYADTLLERNGEGDGEKAVQLLDESLAISSELSMQPLMERVLSRREILKA